MARNNYQYSSGAPLGEARMRSIYRMSDAQANWAQTDPSQPDYIKNKELAEQHRIILVDGQEFLDSSNDSGHLDFVSGKNISLKVEGNKLIISVEGSGGEGGECWCEEYVEGDGIDIIENAYGEKVVSIEPCYIVDLIKKQLRNIPIANEETAGLVKASKEISVDRHGTMNIKEVQMDKIVQGETLIIINGGDFDLIPQ